MTLRTRFAIALVFVMAVFGALGITLVHDESTAQVHLVDGRLAAAVTPSLRLTRTANSTAAAASQLSDLYVALHGISTSVLQAVPGGAGPDLDSLTSTTTGTRYAPQIETLPGTSGTAQWRVALIRRKKMDLVVGLSLAPIAATTAGFERDIAIGGLAVLVLLAAVWFWLIRLGLRPIAEVVELADAVSAGERTRRAPDRSDSSEAARLGHAVNLMLDAEQGREKSLQRFIADASHELRSPITVVFGIAELYRAGALPPGDALDEAMRRIEVESAQMTHLVADLLQLASLDGDSVLPGAAMDCSALVSQEAIALGALHSDHFLTMQIEPHCVAVVDENALLGIVRNLLTNAFVHTPPGTSVSCSVHAVSDEILLEIADRGPGLSASELPHVFERFWRSPAARSREGSGLGLSIVERLARQVGGSVQLRQRTGGGLSVVVHLVRSTSTTS